MSLSALLFALFLRPGAGDIPPAGKDCKQPSLLMRTVPGRIIVTPHLPLPFPLTKRTAALYGLDAPGIRVTPIGATGSYVVDVDAKAPTSDWKRIFSTRFRVEDDVIFRVNEGPNDPVFVLSPDDVWGLREIGAPAAWKNGVGTRDVTAAIVDTGVNIKHPDLVANFWAVPAASAKIEGFDIACEQENMIGYDVLKEHCIPYARDPHGTFMAGIVGAVGNNGCGTVGVNWHVSLLNVAFLDTQKSGCGSRAARALEFLWRVKNSHIGPDLRVVNLSWGGDKSDLVERQLVALANAGVVVVAAAGNANTPIPNVNDITPTYPSGYSSVTTLIAVAAATPEKQIAKISNVGMASIHIAAPGVNIRTTDLLDGVDFTGGTSAAAAFVTGAVALLASQCPEMDAHRLKQIVLDCATRVPALEPYVSNGRFLNLEAASLAVAAECKNPAKTAAPLPVECEPSAPQRVH